MRRAIRRLMVGGLYALKSEPVVRRSRARIARNPSFSFGDEGGGSSARSWRGGVIT